MGDSTHKRVTEGRVYKGPNQEAGTGAPGLLSVCHPEACKAIYASCSESTHSFCEDGPGQRCHHVLEEEQVGIHSNTTASAES